VAPRRRFTGYSLALALLLAPAAIRSQQPDQPWPQDDDYNQQAPAPQGYPQYAQPQQQYGQPQYAQPQGYPQQPAPVQQGYADTYPQPGYAPQQQAQALNAQDIEQLIAPIALYPDALLAQILAASTYPAQVSAADQWLHSLGNVSPDQVAAAATAQTAWDPSVKALTAFPQVLDQLSGNLQWTTNLGNAYYNQPQDVLQTVQVLRQRAEQAGNLQSTPQEQVTDNQGYIALAPANPEVVYVPTYNPWAVYGAPIAPYPGFSFFGGLGSFLVGGPIRYGLGFGIAAFEHTPFGLLAWGLDWLANAVLFHHDGYFTHSNSVRDWGFPHGGPRAFRGGASFAGNHGGYSGRESGYGVRGGGYGGGFGHIPVRPGQGLNQGGYQHGQGFGGVRPENSFANRSAYGGQQNFNRGAQYGAYGRPSMPQQQAYNRMPYQPVRPQGYDNRAQSSAGRPQAQTYGNSYARPGGAYGSGGYGMNPGGVRSFVSPSSVYRAPTPTFSHNGGGYGSGGYNSGARGFSGYGGQQQARNGGFQSFGGGRSQSFGGGKAPKSFSGGGHSFGGGHSSGGGHSGGGHSSNHGGGHHH
jgi:hypothetical protein